MSDSQAKTHANFSLPATIVTKVDVSRLVRELERVDNELTTMAVRAKTGASVADSPVFSDQLAEFLDCNDISLGTSAQRSELIKQLRLLKDSLPVIHMTFAVPADRESLGQLAQWLRTTIHPQVVIAAGLQPALVAGVYMRTPNKVHDLSLRAQLDGQHDLLVKELESLRGRK